MTARGACNHQQFVEGPRAPARHGSWATDVCLRCKKYRTKGHVNGPWTVGPVPKEADYEEES